VEQGSLEAEARLFGRHLVGREPDAEILSRYREACARLWPEPPVGADAARLAWVRRHPWSLGPLEAAAALLDPAGPLRSRVLLTAALLETTPRHANDFLPDEPGLVPLFLRLAAFGTLAVVKALVGALLWPVAGRTAS
jgi:hypothetical protein